MNFTHGHNNMNSPTYLSWMKMRERCLRPKTPGFSNYGGRGIRICDRWNDFRVFLADMGERSEGTTLDRIDNDGNYEPGNCRWADAVTQQNNRPTYNRSITFDNRTMHLFEWAREIGLKPRTLAARINDYHWPIDRALTAPIRKDRRHVSTE